MQDASRRKGLSIIELVLVTAITVILTTVAFINLSGYTRRRDFDTTTKKVIALLRESQSRSMSQASSTIWGVHFDNTSTTKPFYSLFFTSYSSSTQIGTYPLPSSILYATSSVPASSSLDVTFTRITGTPSTSTSIVFEFHAGKTGPLVATSAITITSAGLIN